jgi:uncharacterized protein YdeI (YjbR/CyaY-like superfamily)
MAPVIPDPASIRAFQGEAEFESWLKEHHDTQTELWLRIYKKGSDTPTITYAQALDVALCWGWIDGLKKTYDEVSFLQRFSPRKAKSIWSQINRDHVQRLTRAGRMTPHGQVHIEAAKADGRWDAAYAPGRTMEMPADLLRAIEADAQARKTFQTLNRQNLFALAFRIGNVKTAATRAKKIETFVAMLARGETIYPNGSKKAAGAQ